MKMHKSGLPSKEQAQQKLREVKGKAASSDDPVNARAQQALADWVTEKIRRGDYDD